MAPTEQYYRERAAEARRVADASGLDNVREIQLRSAEAWDGMATRLSRTQRARAELEAKKAAEREALTAADTAA